LGTDTLYFKVEPGRFHMKNVPEHLPPVKLVKYVHNPPPSPKPLPHSKKEILKKQRTIMNLCYLRQSGAIAKIVKHTIQNSSLSLLY
jgi:hypothetical protein